MDSISPLSPDEPVDATDTPLDAAPGVIPAAAAESHAAGPGARSAASPTRAERRLRKKIGPDAELVAWGRAWVSRDGRLHTLLAARTLDFIVLTGDELLVYSTGFLSRRPRRRVYHVPLDRLFVEDRKVSRRRCLAVWTRGRRPLLLELNNLGRNKRVADLLVEHVRRTEAEMAVLPPADPHGLPNGLQE